MTTTEDELDKFENAFGEWLQVNGVELDDLLDDGEWKANIDMNTLKAGFMSLLNTELDKARIEENEQALYLFENQVSGTYAQIGAIAGADNDLSKGIYVEHPEKGRVVMTGDVDLSLPQFFKDRIASLKENIS